MMMMMMMMMMMVVVVMMTIIMMIMMMMVMIMMHSENRSDCWTHCQWAKVSWMNPIYVWDWGMTFLGHLE